MCFSFLSLIYISCIPPPFPFHFLHSVLQFLPLPHPFPFLIYFILNLNFLLLFLPFPPIFLIFPSSIHPSPLIFFHYFNPLPFKISSFPISTLSKTCPSLSSFLSLKTSKALCTSCRFTSIRRTLKLKKSEGRLPSIEVISRGQLWPSGKTIKVVLCT